MGTQFLRIFQKVFRIACPPKFNSTSIVVLSLLGFCIVVRFPFFFPAVIDWDESTLILMGQGILDGQLPYVELWDNKPPVSFLVYSFFVGMLGKSIVAVRIGGLLFVLGTSYLTYFTGKVIWGYRAGLLAATLCIIFISAADSGQATMTEIIAILPLMGALALLVVKEYNTRVLFATGFLLAIAGLVRLNLAYVALFVGLYLFFVLLQRPRRNVYLKLLAYVAGGLLPIIIIAVPYLVVGHGRLWISSVFLAPLNYASAGHSILEVLMLQLHRGFATNALLWAAFLIGAAQLAANWTQQTKNQKQGVMVIGVFLLAIVWSIVTGGAAHEHYLIQIVPLLSLVAGFLFDGLWTTRYRLAVLLLVLLGLLVPAKPIVAQYAVVAERFANGQPLSSGAAYEIAAFIAKENPRKEPMYLLTDHIVYWFTDTKPLTRSTTHPSNLGKEYMLETFAGPGATAKSEMARILAMKPLFIVKKNHEWYIRRKPQAYKMLKNELEKHYVRVARIDKRNIYRRRAADR